MARQQKQKILPLPYDDDTGLLNYCDSWDQYRNRNANATQLIQTIINLRQRRSNFTLLSKGILACFSISYDAIKQLNQTVHVVRGNCSQSLIEVRLKVVRLHRLEKGQRWQDILIGDRSRHIFSSARHCWMVMAIRKENAVETGDCDGEKTGGRDCMNAEDATCKTTPGGPWLSSLLALRGMQMASDKNKRRGEEIRRRRIDLLSSITLNLLTERRNGETRLNTSDWTMGHIKYLWDLLGVDILKVREFYDLKLQGSRWPHN
ncbi:hypothetical protein NC652_007080 [Populus alba x Populus x berolinensis]|nr:hypothetical protein NC652_007080 [Populus alba x Populus x berolinensis]